METKTILELFKSGSLYTAKGGFYWKINFAPKELIWFIHKLENAFLNNENSVYDFGSFILEQKSNRLEIIDGEQRLIVISILVSTILLKLFSLRPLTENEKRIFETILKKEHHYKLNLNYENQLYRDLIDGIKIDQNTNKTESGERLKTAFNYIMNFLSDKNESYTSSFLQFVTNATCKVRYDTFENTNKNISTADIFKLEHDILLHLLKDPEILNALVYVVDSSEQRDLVVIPHNYHIEISNKQITIAILLFVGFENEEYHTIKNHSNLQVVAFCKSVLNMIEFKSIPIRIIDKMIWLDKIINQATNLKVNDLKLLSNLNI